jgi:cysteine desulfurase family protein (TIGR01976 family)
MTKSNYPIEQIREQFPALKRTYKGKPVIYLDGPGGSQVVQGTINAIAAYMSNGGANLHGQFPTSRETEDHMEEARKAIADLVGAEPEEVAFGQNATSLAFSIARALSKEWKEGDEIVVTEMDHRANVDPWVTAAKDKHLPIQWIKVDTESLTLDLSSIESIINEKTRVVAVTIASNAVGTITNIQAIANQAKKAGAILILDAVHGVPHMALDRNQLGVDILLCSAYKFFGPHVGVAVIRKDLFERLNNYKLEPAPAHIPDKLETGTQNHEGITGIKPAVEFIEKLGTGKTRRERILNAYNRIDEYESYLANFVRKGLSEIPGIKLYQSPDSVKKTPTIAFRVHGMASKEVCHRLVEHYGIFIADGDFYASTLAEKLNIGDKGGWVRAGLAPYNTLEEMEIFLKAVEETVLSTVKN